MLSDLSTIAFQDAVQAPLDGAKLAPRPANLLTGCVLDSPILCYTGSHVGEDILVWLQLLQMPAVPASWRCALDITYEASEDAVAAASTGCWRSMLRLRVLHMAGAQCSCTAAMMKAMLPTELLMWPSAAWQVTWPPEGMWHV